MIPFPFTYGTFETVLSLTLKQLESSNPKAPANGGISLQNKNMAMFGDTL
jgi:hypothetical protein